jgi:hypothetical protein
MPNTKDVHTKLPDPAYRRLVGVQNKHNLRGVSAAICWLLDKSEAAETAAEFLRLVVAERDLLRAQLQERDAQIADWGHRAIQAVQNATYEERARWLGRERAARCKRYAPAAQDWRWLESESALEGEWFDQNGDDALSETVRRAFTEGMAGADPKNGMKGGS